MEYYEIFGSIIQKGFHFKSGAEQRKEETSFLKSGPYYRGWIPTGGESIPIEELGAARGDTAIDNILVVWLAEDLRDNQTKIIGWHEQAKVYRDYINAPDRLYNIEARREDTTFLPLTDWDFTVSLVTDWEQERRGRGCWYSVGGNKDLVREIKDYIADYKKTNQVQYIDDRLNDIERIWRLEQMLEKNYSLPEIKFLVESGIDLNRRLEDKYTLLMVAAQCNDDPEIITSLVNNGAHIQVVDKYGETALIKAAGWTDNPEVVDRLIFHGARIDYSAGECGYTPLIIAAARNSNPEVTAELVKQGADIDQTTDFGFTPLMAAVKNNSNPKVAEKLLDSGVDVGDKINGQTVADFAEKDILLRNSDVYFNNINMQA